MKRLEVSGAVNDVLWFLLEKDLDYKQLVEWKKLLVLPV